MTTPQHPALPEPLEDAAGERIDTVDVSSEMEDSYLEYAYSVIYSRALPDARDGSSPCSAASCT
jgi:DNA gyrase subunit A